MRTQSKMAVLGMVLAVGVCAAVSFRKPATETGRAPGVAPNTTAELRRQVPLVVKQAAESPAATLYDAERAGGGAATAPEPPLVRKPVVLRPPATPPSLGDKFEPLLPPLETMLGPNWARAMPGKTKIVLETSSALARSEKRHLVVDGDTLSALAERYLGSAARRLEIYEANRALLSSPDVLPIGVELMLPSASLLPVPGP